MFDCGDLFLKQEELFCELRIGRVGAILRRNETLDASFDGKIYQGELNLSICTADIRDNRILPLESVDNFGFGIVVTDGDSLDV